MAQESFNPADYCFEWTPADNWYKWDRKAAHSQALKARNARLKELKKSGKSPRGWSLPGQTISRGGAGSGNPHIEMCVTSYMINY